MQPYESFKHRTVLLLVTPRVPAGANSTQVVNEMTNGQCVVVNDIVTRTLRGCAQDCTAVLLSGRIITFAMKMSPLSQSHLGQLAEDPPPAAPPPQLSMLIRNTIALVVPLHQQGWNHLTHDPSASCHPVRVQYQQAAHRWQELYMMMTLMMMMSPFVAHGCINLNAQCTHDRAHAGGMFYSQLWECLLQTGLTVAVPSKRCWQAEHHWWKLCTEVYDCFCILCEMKAGWTSLR